MLFLLFIIFLSSNLKRITIKEKYDNDDCSALPKKCQCIEDNNGIAHCGFIKDSVVYACKPECCYQKCNIYNTEMYDKEMEYALKLSKESVQNKIENDESHILGVVDDESRFEKEIFIY